MTVRKLAGRGGRPATGRHTLVRVVTRLVVMQAFVAALVGLPFSRRHLPSILITFSLVAAFCALAVLARTGTRGAWLLVTTVEGMFFLYGLSRFLVARYAGGTLLSVVIVGTLLHPAVARAYSASTGTDRQEGGDVPLGDATGDTVSGKAMG